MPVIYVKLAAENTDLGRAQAEGDGSAAVDVKAKMLALESHTAYSVAVVNEARGSAVAGRDEGGEHALTGQEQAETSSSENEEGGHEAVNGGSDRRRGERNAESAGAESGRSPEGWQTFAENDASEPVTALCSSPCKHDCSLLQPLQAAMGCFVSVLLRFASLEPIHSG